MTVNSGPQFQPVDADFLAPPDTARLQREYWREQSAYVARESKFYRQHLDGITLKGDIAEIRDLPFTDKEQLRHDQREHPPFGSYLAAPPEQVVRLHRTSGTSGSAMNLALTAQDAQMTAQVGARAQRAAGLGPEHRVVHCLNYQLWMGGYTDHATLEATGAMVVPFGVGSSHHLVRTIRDLDINAISCTPSYPAVLEQVIREDFEDLEPADLGLELGLFGGEPGLDDPAMRQRLESTWGFAVRNANYGVSDVLCNFAGQSVTCNDLHLVATDVLHAEIIDPVTETSLPWREGEQGELVLTHLCKQAQPLVRFRSGDIVRLTAIDQAECGRWAPRFRVIGRSDDMVVVRGINVFPTMIAEVLNRIEPLSGEYRILLDQSPPYDALPLEAELRHPVDSTSALQREIESRIKEEIGVTARVELAQPGTLPRTSGKTRRVIRNA